MIRAAKIDKKDALRIRVASLKTRFKKGTDYTTLYIYEFGKQTKDQISKIRNVWNLRDVDEAITKNLETIANKLN